MKNKIIVFTVILFLLIGLYVYNEKNETVKEPEFEFIEPDDFSIVEDNVESIITNKYLPNELHVFTSYYADRDLIISNKRYYCFM